jgi:hypothetical protein
LGATGHIKPELSQTVEEITIIQLVELPENIIAGIAIQDDVVDIGGIPPGPP